MQHPDLSCAHSLDVPDPLPVIWSSVDLRNSLYLLAISAFSVFAIGPQGEFPLNDDWAYILPVKWLVEQHRLQLTDWQFMTLIGQICAGAIVSALFGFSITGLRLLVLATAALSVVLVYVISRLAGARRPWALGVASLLLCNPVFMVTSASFMTDTPFLAACLLSILFFLLWQQRSVIFFGWCAWLLVLYASSIRQSGVALAIGFSFFILIRQGFSRTTFLAGIFPTCIVVSFLAVYPMIIDRTVGMPSMYNLPAQEAKAFLVGLLHGKIGYLWMAAKTLCTAIMYLGFCMIPALPVILRLKHSCINRRIWPTIAAVGLLATLITAGLVLAGHAKPFAGNTLFDFGLGIRTLENDGPVTATLPRLWWAITFFSVLGVIGSARLTWNMISRIRTASTAHFQNFPIAYVGMLAATLLIYNLPFLTRGGVWFDRYSIPNLALFGLLAAPFVGRPVTWTWHWTFAVFVVGVYLVFSIVGTRDYLEWNRKRWEAASELARTYGLNSEQIDAGFEYNNYQPRRFGDRHRQPDEVLLLNHAAEYRVAFSPLPHHKVLKVLPCDTWLYGSPSAVFMLRLEPAAGTRAGNAG